MCLWPMLETRFQPTYSLDIYIIFISLITTDVFQTYVRDKGSTNLFPGHLNYIYLSHYSWCVCDRCYKKGYNQPISWTSILYLSLSLQLMCLWPMLETKVQPTYSLDIYIIFISLITADVFLTHIRDKGSTNLFPGHLNYIYLFHYSWYICDLC
jgi:hypothetical protein